MKLPEMSIVLVGRVEGSEPTAMAVVDRLIPTSLNAFTLAELGAFRALAVEVIRVIDRTNEDETP